MNVTEPCTRLCTALDIGAPPILLVLGRCPSCGWSGMEARQGEHFCVQQKTFTPPLPCLQTPFSSHGAFRHALPRNRVIAFGPAPSVVTGSAYDPTGGSSGQRCRHRPYPTQPAHDRKQRCEKGWSCLGSALFLRRVGGDRIELELERETWYTCKSKDPLQASGQDSVFGGGKKAYSTSSVSVRKKHSAAQEHAPHRVPQERWNNRTRGNSERSTHKKRCAVCTNGTFTRRLATPVYTRAVLALRAACTTQTSWSNAIRPRIKPSGIARSTTQESSSLIATCRARESTFSISSNEFPRRNQSPTHMNGSRISLDCFSSFFPSHLMPSSTPTTESVWERALRATLLACIGQGPDISIVFNILTLQPHKLSLNSGWLP